MPTSSGSSQFQRHYSSTSRVYNSPATPGKGAIAQRTQQLLQQGRNRVTSQPTSHRTLDSTYRDSPSYSYHSRTENSSPSYRTSNRMGYTRNNLGSGYKREEEKTSYRPSMETSMRRVSLTSPVNSVTSYGSSDTLSRAKQYNNKIYDYPSHKVGSSRSVGHLQEEDENNNRLPKISSTHAIGRFDSKEEGCVGLQNIGNTCWSESWHTEPVDLNKTVAYRNLMQTLWEKGTTSPKEFKSAVQRFAPRFRGYNQQDAQEFLRYVLEGLHEDVNLVQVRPKGRTYDESKEARMNDEEKSEEYWKRYLKFDDSKVVDIFVGQLRSTLTCEKCGYKSVTFDPFWDLSLQIPEMLNNVSIVDCLEAFTKKEYLDGDEMPTCERCKQRRKCSKELSIQKFPEVLVLHLKRFSGDRYRSKLSKKVRFPSELKELYKFSANTRANARYSLYGVCCHTGSVYSGHYVAYCKHPYKSCWHLFNDSRVSSASGPESIDSSEAYVLFYQKEH